MRKPIVYIVDDNSDDRFFLETAITSALPDATIIAFKDGMDVINELFKLSTIPKEYDQIPDLIFLDLNLTTLNGQGVLDMLQQNPRLKKIKVIVLSGAKAQNEEELLKMGATHFFMKPASGEG